MLPIIILPEPNYFKDRKRLIKKDIIKIIYIYFSTIYFLTKFN